MMKKLLMFMVVLFVGVSQTFALFEVIVDNVQNFNEDGGQTNPNRVLADFDASGGNKLVVTITGEIINYVDVTSLTYAGVELTLAVEIASGLHQYSGIWYLDNPAQVAPVGDIVLVWDVQDNGNGTVMYLSI